MAEAGDPEKPKLAFFFDEAHLLFNDAPQVLLDKIEQVIRLIRSKAWASGSFAKPVIFRIPCSGRRYRAPHASRAFTP
ncbi:helicase HerA-like domain-containing protein [Escherichia coli]